MNFRLKYNLYMALGLFILFDTILFYDRNSILYYPSSTTYSYSVDIATYLTIITVFLILFALILSGYGIYKTIKINYMIPKLKRFWPITMIYGIIIAVIGGMVHIAPSGFHYPHYAMFLFGLPMFTPNFLLYYSKIIGIYIYPLQLLSLFSVSLIGGAIMSLSIMGITSRKKSTLSIVGAVGVCPACAAGTLFGLVIGASPFLSSFYFNVLYGNTVYEILITVFSIFLMFVFLLYMIRIFKIHTNLVNKENSYEKINQK